jgi:hypothetical protein
VLLLDLAHHRGEGLVAVWRSGHVTHLSLVVSAVHRRPA